MSSRGLAFKCAWLIPSRHILRWKPLWEQGNCGRKQVTTGGHWRGESCLRLCYKTCFTFWTCMLCTGVARCSECHTWTPHVTLHTALFTLHTPHIALHVSSHLIWALPTLSQLISSHLAQSTSQYNFVLKALHEALPSTTWQYKACTNTSCPTLYYKPCTKHLLLCTTNRAPSTS